MNDLITILHKEIRHEKILQVVIHNVYLNIEDILEEKKLIDDVVGKLSYTSKIPTSISIPSFKALNIHRFYHLVHGDNQGDHIIGKLLEILERTRLCHIGGNVLIVH